MANGSMCVLCHIVHQFVKASDAHRDGAFRTYCTVIVPVICGWIVQWYAKLPVVLNVRCTVVLMLFGTSAGTPVAAVNVTLCSTPSNVNVTVVPDATVRFAGRNASDGLASIVFGTGVPPVPVV